MKNRKQKTRGGPGLSPPSGSRKYAQGGQGGGAGKQHQVRAGRMALRVGFEQGFPGLDHYWCRHTSPHEVSGAQCLSRRLILAVFQLVFVFRLGGPTPSEAAGGRPQTEGSKTLGLVQGSLRWPLRLLRLHGARPFVSATVVGECGAFKTDHLQHVIQMTSWMTYAHRVTPHLITKAVHAYHVPAQ